MQNIVKKSQCQEHHDWYFRTMVCYTDHTKPMSSIINYKDHTRPVFYLILYFSKQSKMCGPIIPVTFTLILPLLT